MQDPSASRVADRYLARLAAQRVVASAVPRTATDRVGAAQVRAEMSVAVLEAFAVAAAPAAGIKIGSLTRRLKTLWEAFQTAPKKWDAFKKMLGIRASNLVGLLRELPGKIKAMIKDAKRYLSKVGDKLREVPLVGLYFDVARKMPSVNDLLVKSLDHMPPAVRNTILKITSKMKSLAELIDHTVTRYPVVKPASVVLSAGIFAMIWLNVTEISWDVPEIIRGFLGGYAWTELLQSLPESGMGLLISMMFPGIPGGLVWNALLPITIALRMGYLIQKDYVEWAPGRQLRVRWDKMGIEPPAGIPLTVSL